MKLFHCLLTALAVVWFGQNADAVTIDLVTVGNPGNAPDQLYTSLNPDNLLFGSVAETYQIGKYEVTNSQYAEFLNAVAATDTHSLYNSNMGSISSLRGGITQSGISGSFTYAVKTDFGNKPVNFVGFWEAARFTNWLNNGQPTGSQDNNTTEDGAYTLGGVTIPVNASVTRNSGAEWFIPSEDQWYKAAFHHPQADGGDTDDYWLYATGSNADPTLAFANATGDISNPGSNVANYNDFADWNGEDGNVTTVGSAGLLSESFYGTSDQSGNVWEWNEAIISTSFRGFRGGAFNSSTTNLPASRRLFKVPSDNNSITGFRVAFQEFQPTNSTVPEPSTLALAALGFLALIRRRRRK